MGCKLRTTEISHKMRDADLMDTSKKSVQELTNIQKKKNCDFASCWRRHVCKKISPIVVEIFWMRPFVVLRRPLANLKGHTFLVNSANSEALVWMDDTNLDRNAKNIDLRLELQIIGDTFHLSGVKNHSHECHFLFHPHELHVSFWWMQRFPWFTIFPSAPPRHTVGLNKSGLVFLQCVSQAKSLSVSSQDMCKGKKDQPNAFTRNTWPRFVLVHQNYPEFSCSKTFGIRD